jgi:hypothetical protein
VVRCSGVVWGDSLLELGLGEREEDQRSSGEHSKVIHYLSASSIFVTYCLIVNGI